MRRRHHSGTAQSVPPPPRPPRQRICSHERFLPARRRGHPLTPGQTVMRRRRRGKYIPHLCWHPTLPPHGSCKLCTVKIGGRFATSCTVRAAAGQEVENRTAELDAKRRTLLQMLFVEGNHFCPRARRAATACCRPPPTRWAC